MQQFRIYQVDAFASKVFAGNPAAVIPMHEWLPDDILQSLAIENNLSETAFYKPGRQGCFDLRWFTPGFEVDLCGHATLATAHVLFEHEGFNASTIRFQTRVGELTVEKSGGGYVMDFPLDKLDPRPVPDWATRSLGCEILHAFEGREDWLLIVESQKVIEALEPDLTILCEPDARGVIVSAPGDDVDFVSRCFFPKAGIPEDPVTGSAHTTMAAWWVREAGRQQFQARQLSARGGNVGVEVRGDRVLLTGQAATFLAGLFSCQRRRKADPESNYRNEFACEISLVDQRVPDVLGGE